jgi:hypothetical protein
MPKTTKAKRFTVSLEPTEHDALRQIADSHRPPLSLQYVVRYAMQRFLDESKEKQLQLNLK